MKIFCANVAVFTITFIQIMVVDCAIFDPHQNSIASALQNILSPANTEKALQMIQMAAKRQVSSPAPCREEIIAPTAIAPNRRVVPLGAIQRPPPNGGQFHVKQTSPNIPVNLHNLAEIVSMNAMQNPVMPKFAMPNMPIIIMTSRDIAEAPVAKEVSCPCASQTPFLNPFLPAASPISAWTSTTSGLLPPVTQSRGHFLRKIPIPPPTL